MEKNEWTETNTFPTFTGTIRVLTREGKETNYYRTGSAICDICLRDQYTHWRPLTEEEKKEHYGG